MPPPIYPIGTVRALLGTEHVSAATRAALQARLDAPADYQPQFFAPETFALLEAVAARLRQHVYTVGNTVDPAVGYRAFRGRDPKVDALMKQRGFPLAGATAAPAKPAGAKAAPKCK